LKEVSHGDIAQWLRERCRRERLSLRQVADRSGLSHATVAQVMKTGAASPATVRKLVQAFYGDGKQGMVVEDELLVAAGHRTPRPNGEMSEAMAWLLDKLSHFSEPQLRLVGQFADFIAEVEMEGTKK